MGAHRIGASSVVKYKEIIEAVKKQSGESLQVMGIDSERQRRAEIGGRARIWRLPID